MTAYLHGPQISVFHIIGSKALNRDQRDTQDDEQRHFLFITLTRAVKLVQDCQPSAGQIRCFLMSKHPNSMLGRYDEILDSPLIITSGFKEQCHFNRRRSALFPVMAKESLG